MGNLGMELNSEFNENMDNSNANIDQEVNQNQDTNQSNSTLSISFEQFKLLFQDKSQFTKENLGLKTYLPYVEKTMMINDICDMVLQFDRNGLAYVDYCMLEFVKVIYFMKYYLPYVELNEDEIIGQYDWIVENKVLNTLYKIINDKVNWELEELVDLTLASLIKRNNSIEATLAKNLNKLQDNLDVIMSKINGIDQGFVEKIVNKLSKSLKNFDPKNYEALQSMLKVAKGEN
jgi:hypothetical protein